MYKILWFNKFISLVIYIAVSIVIIYISGNVLSILFLTVFGIWLWFYLGGLKIYISENYLMKETGKVFNRKHYIMLKNIQGFQVVKLYPIFPTFIRIYCMNGNINIYGMSYHQAKEIEKAILYII